MDLLSRRFLRSPPLNHHHHLLPTMAEQTRLRELTKQRQEAHDDIERQKSLLSAESTRDRTSASRFVGRTEGLEETLKTETVGLQRLEDFQSKKKALEEQIAREAARTDELKWVLLPTHLYNPLAYRFVDWRQGD